MRAKIKKIIFILAGLIFTFLAIVGIFVPLLPTTPFLLLAAFFYGRSSARLYHWLLNNKILGRYIYNYIHHRSVSKKLKIFTIIVLWASLLLSMYFLKNVYLAIFLLIIGAAVTTHIILLKTHISKIGC